MIRTALPSRRALGHHARGAHWPMAIRPLVAALTVLVSLPLSLYGQTNWESIQVHGLISQGYMRSSSNNYLARSADGTFEFNEAILNFSVPVDEHLRVGLQLISRDMGSDGNNVVTLDWGYGDYRWNDYAGLRVGKIKVHNGLYNKGRDVDLLRTAILLPHGIYPEIVRDFSHSCNGLEYYGSARCRVAGRLSYELFMGTLSITDLETVFWESAFATTTDYVTQLLPDGVTTSLSDRTVNVRYLKGGALVWNTPLTGLRLAGNLIQGKLSMSTRLSVVLPELGGVDGASSTGVRSMPLQGGTYSYPLDIELGIDRLSTLSAELIRGNWQLAAEMSQTQISLDAQGVQADLGWDGWYGMVNYRVHERVELGTYYSEFYNDRDDKKGKLLVARGDNAYEAWQKDLAISARFDITDNWLLKLETHVMDGVGQVNTQGETADLEQDWILYLAKMSYHF
jgi:hypothetical protein